MRLVFLEITGVLYNQHHNRQLVNREATRRYGKPTNADFDRVAVEHFTLSAVANLTKLLTAYPDCVIVLFHPWTIGKDLAAEKAIFEGQFFHRFIVDVIESCGILSLRQRIQSFIDQMQPEAFLILDTGPHMQDTYPSNTVRVHELNMFTEVDLHAAMRILSKQ